MRPQETELNPEYQQLQWMEGPLEGLTLDFIHQTLRYRSCPPVHLEYQKIQVLYFLAKHCDRYITGSKMNMEADLNSIDLPKMISSIKSAFARSLPRELDKKEVSALFDVFIHKSRVDGNMGYQLRLPEMQTLQRETRFDAHRSTAESYKVSEHEAVPKCVTGPADFLRTNWPVLFILLICLPVLFVFNHFGHPLFQSLYHASLAASMSSFSVVVLVLAALPQLCGILIDTPLAILHYLFSHDRKLSPRRFYLTVKYGDPECRSMIGGRFNLSSRHILYGLICNGLGAGIVIFMRLILDTVPGLKTMILQRNDPMAAYLSFLVALFIVLLMYYYEEKRTDVTVTIPDMEEENGFNYLLTRAHVLANIVYLTASLTFLQQSTFYLFLFAPLQTKTLESFPAAAISFILISYAYFWFTGISPFARQVNATAKKNYILGPPVVIFSSLWIFHGLFLHHIAGIAIVVMDFFLLLHWGIKMFTNRFYFFDHQGFIPSLSFFSIGLIAFLCALLFL